MINLVIRYGFFVNPLSCFLNIPANSAMVAVRQPGFEGSIPSSHPNFSGT